MDLSHFKKALLLTVCLLAATVCYADKYPTTFATTTAFTATCQSCPKTIDELYAQLRRSGVEIIQTGDQLEIVLGVDRFFGPKSNTRLYYNQADTMKLVTQLLLTRGNVPIKVYGHTDNVGSDKNKLYRSKQQADTIAGYLWSNGIPLGNIKAVGCGDTEPVSSNQTADGSAANRRIEIFTNSAPY